MLCKCFTYSIFWLFVTSAEKCCYSVTKVVSDSLQPHGLQHSRLPCPSLSPTVCSDSCPLSQWCYLTISCREIHFIFILILYPTLLNPLFGSNNLLVNSLGFPICKIRSDLLLFHLPSGFLWSHFIPWLPDRTSITILDRSSKHGHLCLLLGFRKKTFPFLSGCAGSLLLRLGSLWLQCSGFSSWRLLLLRAWAPGVGFSNCATRA